MHTRSIIFILLLMLAVKPAKAQDIVEDLSNNGLMFSTIATGPRSMFSGENNGRIYLNPYNGVYESKDFGLTWQQKGLEGRGVNKLIYKDSKLYAATYYVKNNTAGLFISTDNGQTWGHYGNNSSLATVGVEGSNIYTGTYSHGLYVSKDSGVTWEQKIGDGMYGPNINLIETSETIVFAATNNLLYSSTDNGASWKTVSYFNNKTITSMSIYQNVILAGTNNNGGIFRSTDKGTTWKKLNSWGNNSVGKILNIEGMFYANRYNLVTHTNELLFSNDSGETWQIANSTLPTDYYVLDAGYVYALNNYLFLVTVGNKLLRYRVPDKELQTLPFLSIPWNTNNNRDINDKIYSYFDHTLPLLGYWQHKEPTNVNATTTNFRGTEDKEPFMYYSSHDGYDYSLRYGTPILAAAGGIATYHYCKGCGNTIKIDHQNGYQSTYMHLQNEGLITKNNPIEVQTGTQIGLVGMTGNTTGPHLHFAILHDKNYNGKFEDDIPDGRIDPYGWQNNKRDDPWANYTWQDVSGSHSGTTSHYLWTNVPNTFRNYVNSEQNTTVALSNMILQIDKDAANSNFMIKLTPNSLPIKISPNKRYVANTSAIIEVIDHFGQKLESFSKDIKISYLLTEIGDATTVPENLQIHFWDYLEELWKPLETHIKNGLVTAATTHFSYYAMFETIPEVTEPITTMSVNGASSNDWYIEYPKITLVTDTPDTRIFYSYNNEELWYEYTKPFDILIDGVTIIRYRSYNEKSIEQTQEMLIKVNTRNLMTKSIRVLDSKFSL